jgi:hypothetical protein
VRDPRPTRSSAARARRRAPNQNRREYTSGSITFSRAVARGSSSKLWKTKPISSLRMRASAPAPSPSVRRAFNSYVPDVGRSRHPRMFMSVDLPEPDAPITATNSLRPISRLTPSSARTSVSPIR